MRPLLGYVLFGALTAHVAVHVAIAVGFAQRRRWGKAVLALLVAPLAPWWAWPAGMRRRTIAWLTTLAVYALTVALA